MHILTILFAELKINNAGAVVLSILAFFAILVGLYFLCRSVIKEFKRIRDEKINLIEGLESKNDLLSDIDYYISKMSTSGSFTLMLIELTSYGDVISAFGERSAVTVLTKAAHKIQSVLPKGCQMTRYKENQFLIFYKNVMDKDIVTEKAELIMEAMQDNIKVMGNANVRLIGNMGITFYPIHARSTKELLKNLNLALYLARKNGNNQFLIYSNDNQKEVDNLAYYQQINEGIKQKEFCLFYQPIVDMNSNEVIALEGLLRWNHPTLGVVPPYKFINIMEQSGDIIWVGNWGFESLVKEYFEVTKECPDKKIMFTLNLSPKQLIYENLVNDFAKIVRKYKINTSDFCFEVNEITLYGKDPVLTKNLDKLNELGFKIAIDGYGVDYGMMMTKSTNQAPINYIKLDRDFVEQISDPINQKMLDMLLVYSEERQVTIIAQGIETQENVNALKEHKIYYGQGYFYSMPLDAEDSIAYINHEQRRFNSGDGSQHISVEELDEKFKTNENKQEELKQEDKTKVEPTKEDKVPKENKQEEPKQEEKPKVDPTKENEVPKENKQEELKQEDNPKVESTKENEVPKENKQEESKQEEKPKVEPTKESKPRDKKSKVVNKDNKDSTSGKNNKK